MKRKNSRTVRRRGISRIDQSSTRTHGWFARAGFYKRRDGRYVARHRKFFGDVTYGGKRRALRAARAYLVKVERARRGTGPRSVRRRPAQYSRTDAYARM